MTTIKTKLIKLFISVAFVILLVCLGLAFMTVSNKAYADADSRVPTGLADDPVDFCGVKVSHPDGLVEGTDYSITDTTLFLYKLGFTLAGEIEEQYLSNGVEVYVTNEQASSTNDISFNGKLNINAGIIFMDGNPIGDLSFNVNSDVSIANIDMNLGQDLNSTFTFRGNGTLNCLKSDHIEFPFPVEQYLRFCTGSVDSNISLVLDGPSFTMNNVGSDVMYHGIHSDGPLTVKKGNFNISTISEGSIVNTYAALYSDTSITIDPSYDGEMFFSGPNGFTSLACGTPSITGLQTQGTVGIGKKLEKNN